MPEEKNVNIGNLTPGFAKTVIPWEETIPGTLRLNIFFVARNGGYIELYRRLKAKNYFAVAIKVDLNGKLVFERISENYPRNKEGNIDW